MVPLLLLASFLLLRLGYCLTLPLVTCHLLKKGRRL
jgi:hypothetical protein